MKIPKLLVIAMVAGLVLAGAGCGKKTAGKTAENIIESQTDGQADVDIDDSAVTINTNGTSHQAGESVSLPAGFPTDVYVIDGTIKTATTVDENNGFTATVDISESLADARTTYESQLIVDGWTIDATLAVATNVTISATKDNRFATVGIYDTDGQVQVVVTTGTNE